MGVIGSLAELTELTVRDLSDLDPHRPFIDEVTFTRPGEEGIYRRGGPGIATWEGSRSMPFPHWGAPHRQHAGGEAAPPPQIICEASGTTPGPWFSPLHARP